MAIDRDAALKQAEKLLRQGKLDGAIEQYVRLVDDQPQDWNAINALGDLYLKAGKNDKAVEACDVAIRTYPTGDKIPDAYYRKGLALKNLRDLNGARDAWEHVVKTNPDSDAGRLAKQRLEQIKRPN